MKGKLPGVKLRGGWNDFTLFCSVNTHPSLGYLVGKLFIFVLINASRRLPKCQAVPVKLSFLLERSDKTVVSLIKINIRHWIQKGTITFSLTYNAVCRSLFNAPFKGTMLDARTKVFIFFFLLRLFSFFSFTFFIRGLSRGLRQCGA